MRRLVAVIAVGLFASGCAGPDRWDLARAPVVAEIADPYRAELVAGYRALAVAERAEFDWTDAAGFIDRAIAAASGPVAPPQLESRGLPEAAFAALFEARMRLLQLQGSHPTMLRAARDVARTQIGLECWMQEAEEGHQPDDIAACRAAFETAAAEAEAAAQLPATFVALLPKEGGAIGGVEAGGVLLDTAYAAAGLAGGAVRTLPVLAEEIEASFGPALGAQPPPAQTFVVYFARGATILDDEARTVLAAARAAIAARPAADVEVIGHADTEGSEAVNMRISRRRADLVATGLRGAGFASLTRVVRGESDLVVATPDDVSERMNRRVEIVVR